MLRPMLVYGSTPTMLTLPVGGLVNHKVHLFRRGCLTLKCSGLWKTVTGPLASVELSPVEPFEAEPLELPLVEWSGEMGMVLSGTGSEPLTAVAMMTEGECVVRCGRAWVEG
jgi:hypothetical protein